MRSRLTTVPSSRARTVFGMWDRRFTLAALQVAVCLTPALAAGLLGKSLVKLTRADLGLNPERVTLLSVETFARGDTTAQHAALTRHLLARVRQMPGVEAASWASHALPSPLITKKTLSVATANPHEASSRPALSVRFNVVGDGYFETIRMPLVAGRGFDPRDSDRDASRTAILNETAARRLFGDAVRALGQRIHITDDREERDREVVGVVRNVVYDEPDEAPAPYLFEPMDRSWNGGMVLHVLGPREPGALIAQVKRELRAIDPSIALSDTSTLEQQVASRIAAPSLAARLALLASGLGVALALLGLYSVLMWLVAQRRTELAIRMSIGATPGQIVMSAAAFGLKITLAGAAIGLLVSYFALRLIATQLRGVDIHDLSIYALVVALVLAAGLAACLLPARHAARLDPWGILRR